MMGDLRYNGHLDWLPCRERQIGQVNLSPFINVGLDSNRVHAP